MQLWLPENPNKPLELLRRKFSVINLKLLAIEDDLFSSLLPLKFATSSRSFFICWTTETSGALVLSFRCFSFRSRIICSPPSPSIDLLKCGKPYGFTTIQQVNLHPYPPSDFLLILEKKTVGDYSLKGGRLLSIAFCTFWDYIITPTALRSVIYNSFFHFRTLHRSGSG